MLAVMAMVAVMMAMLTVGLIHLEILLIVMWTDSNESRCSNTPFEQPFSSLCSSSIE
jgi:hypothetical protein